MPFSAPILKAFGLAVAVCFFALDGIAQIKIGNSAAFNRRQSGRRIKIRNNSPSSSARFRIEKPRSYSTKKPGNYAAKPLGTTARNIRINRRVQKKPRGNVFSQKKIVNFSSQGGRRWSNSRYANRSKIAKASRQVRMSHYIVNSRKKVYLGKGKKKEKAFLNDIANRPLRTRRYQPKSAQPTYNTYAQKRRRTPNDNYSPARWGMGWYSKWNRRRIAAASNKEERAWKGDISGRKLIIDSWASRVRRSGKNILPSRKKYLGIGGGPPNSSQHAIALKTLKGATRKFKRLTGNIEISRLQRNPNSNRNAIVARAPIPGSNRTGMFAGNIRIRRPQRNPNSNRNAIAARAPIPGSNRTGMFAGNIRIRRPQRNPNSNRNAIAARAPIPGSNRTGMFAGNIRIRRPQRNPNSNRNTIAARAPIPGSNRTGMFAGNIRIRRPQRNPNSNRNAIAARAPIPGSNRTGMFAGNIRIRRPQRNPNSNRNAIAARAPIPGSNRTGMFAGNIRIRRPQRNPNSNRNAIAARAPIPGSNRPGMFAGNIRIRRPRRGVTGAIVTHSHGLPNVEAERFRGTAKARKFTDPRLHPDAQFAHIFVKNVKGERTLLVSLKLFLEKLFNKNGTQPPHLKNRPKKLHYDDREQKLWYR